MSAAGVVAALRAEARTLGSPIRRGSGPVALSDGTLVAVSGMGYAAAAAAATSLVDAGAVALVSWGMAGGLDPALQAGTICLPGVVITREGATFAADHDWREIMGAAITAGRTVVTGTLLTSAEPLDDVAGKGLAFRETGAVAVDMESAAVAAIAALHRLPFIAVRVIVDTAADAVPPAVAKATSGGRVRVLRLILELARRPADIAPLIRLAKRYRKAMQSLVSIARTGALAPLAFAASSRTRIA